MGGGLGLLVATAAVITVQLETSFAALLSITDALLWSRLRDDLLLRLLSLLLLLSLIREAFIVARFQLLVEPSYEWERHSCHEFEFSWVDNTYFGISTRESHNGTGQKEVIYIQETLLLDAEVGKELSISPQILWVLGCDLTSEDGTGVGWLTLNRGCCESVTLKQTSLVYKYMHIIEYSITEKVPIQGGKDLTLLGYYSLIGVGVFGCRVQAASTRVFHFVKLSRDHQAWDRDKLQIMIRDILLHRCVEIHHQHTMMNCSRGYL